MSLDAVASALGATQVLDNDMSVESWKTDTEERAAKVALFRNYVDGDHRANLTDEMRKQLRIENKTGDTQHSPSLTELNANHCDVIVETMADRLEVTAIDADNKPAQDWIAKVMRQNRFDGLQGDVHRATCRDGDTYLLAEWDKERQQVRWYHEPAYDGIDGMVVLYDKPGQIGVAVKIWRTTTENLSDTVRVNVYYPDRIEKYTSKGGVTLEKYTVEGEPWPALWKRKDGKPIGVPVIHFPNRSVEYHDYGYSEIEQVIPLQDVLNRILYSMVMTAENTAFPMRLLIGTEPPAGITPGMFIKVLVRDNQNRVAEPSPEQIEWFKSIRLETTKQGDLQPFIEQARWTQQQMYEISGTPLPASGNDTESGESQKQREIKLLGKVRRFQVKAGNAWEDVAALSHVIESAYAASPPPAYTTFSTKWRNPELRDDSVVITNALAVADRVGEREFLRLIAPVFGYDDAKIDEILRLKQQEMTQKIRTVGATLPQFGNFQQPVLNGTNPAPAAAPPTN